MSLVALQLAHVLQCLRRMFGKVVLMSTCEHMKGVAMAHDVTKQSDY
jgi:hypothetical protein